MVQIMTPIAPKKGKRTRYMVVLRSETDGTMVTTYHVFGQGPTPEAAKLDAILEARRIWRDLSFHHSDVVRHPMGNGQLPKAKPTRKATRKAPVRKVCKLRKVAR